MITVPPQQETETPLWSDDEIVTQYKEAFGEDMSENTWAFIVWLRDEYEEERATLAERLAGTGQTK